MCNSILDKMPEELEICFVESFQLPIDEFSYLGGFFKSIVNTRLPGNFQEKKRKQ